MVWYGTVWYGMVFTSVVRMSADIVANPLSCSGEFS